MRTVPYILDNLADVSVPIKTTHSDVVFVPRAADASGTYHGWVSVRSR